jgi:hypothetical protein
MISKAYRNILSTPSSSETSTARVSPCRKDFMYLRGHSQGVFSISARAFAVPLDELRQRLEVTVLTGRDIRSLFHNFEFQAIGRRNCEMKIDFTNLSKVLLLMNHDIQSFSNMFDLHICRASRCVHSLKWFGDHLDFLHCRSGTHFVIDCLYLFHQRHRMIDSSSYLIQLFVHIEKVLPSMVSFHIPRRNLVVMLETAELS